ncbi:MAG: hypothetical protein V5B60_20955 [Accumulibacter sp.]|jgi:hypothetical protein|uniref:hypothetical protein n=1 Tax=Accumulibacter sp. TaxID=2053492 RepID=UPI002FC2E79C
MSVAAVALAALSAVCVGAFWPTLKVNFDSSFSRRFLIPTFVVAAADCFVLAGVICWWTAIAYPLLALVGVIAISPFTSGRHLQTVILGGGIWLVGISAVVLVAVALALRVL